MPVYVVVGGHHGRHEESGFVQYKPGDRIEMDRKTAKAFGEQFRLATADDEVTTETENTATDTDTATDPSTVAAPFDIVAMSANDSISLIDSVESIDELIALYNDESENEKPRKSVLAAIEVRLKALGYVDTE